jgi:hypothetical protein
LVAGQHFASISDASRSRSGAAKLKKVSMNDADKEISMNTFWKFVPWISKVVVLLCTAIFVAISVQPLLHPAASAASQGIAFTSSLGLTIFRVSFAGFPLGCAGFLVYCLVSRCRTLTGLIFSALLLGFVLIVRIYGMEVDSSVRQSMPLVVAEIVLVVITLAGIVIENKFRSHNPRTASEPNAPSLS